MRIGVVGFHYRSPPWAPLGFDAYDTSDTGLSCVHVAPHKGHVRTSPDRSINFADLLLSHPSEIAVGIPSSCCPNPLLCSTFHWAQRQQLASFSGGAGGAGRICGWRRLRKYTPVFVGEERALFFHSRLAVTTAHRLIVAGMLRYLLGKVYGDDRPCYIPRMKSVVKSLS